MKEKKCYKCGAKATSREHVPPLCIFPEKKDLNRDFRINLIKVPSCDEHNLKKSKDDEFLMACVSGIVGNNSIGYLQLKTKIRRSFDNTKGLVNRVVGNYQEKEVRDKNGVALPVLAGSLDYTRLQRCIEYIAYGLYFHEYGKQFIGDAQIIFGFLRYRDENINTRKAYLKDVFENETDKYPKRGDNPEVFYYQIVPQNTPGLIALKFTFFEGTDFFIRMKDQDSKEIFDLGEKMIQDGFKVTIKYNGKDYVFN